MLKPSSASTITTRTGVLDELLTALRLGQDPGHGAVPGPAGEPANQLVQQPAEDEEADDQPGDPGRHNDDLVGHLQLAVVTHTEEGREPLGQGKQGVTDRGHKVAGQNRHLAARS
jgi:hypothetical protein